MSAQNNADKIPTQISAKRRKAQQEVQTDLLRAENALLKAENKRLKRSITELEQAIKEKETALSENESAAKQNQSHQNQHDVPGLSTTPLVCMHRVTASLPSCVKKII